MFSFAYLGMPNVGCDDYSTLVAAPWGGTGGTRQGRRGPPGHREIVPVAPENRSDMGPQS